jgi:hypothetical protein
VNFALGRLLYSCMSTPAHLNINYYTARNRDITFYVLNLPPQAKETVRQCADNNVRPEIGDSLYHHFRDNGATRVRDRLDLATGGQFQAQLGDAPGSYTYRQQVRRHTWFSPFFDWFLSFLMGQGIDRPGTVWEEMFLPSEIGRQIQAFRYTDAAGREQPLVSSVEEVNRAIGRPQALETPRQHWRPELCLALIIAAALLGFRALENRKPLGGRAALGISQSLLGLFFGTAGLLLFFMMAFTNHDYAFYNSNILFVNPLLLLAVPWGIQYAAGKHTGRRFSPERLLRILWGYVFAAGLATLLIKLLPPFYQQNQPTQALVLPIALALALPRLKRP